MDISSNTTVIWIMARDDDIMLPAMGVYYN